MNNRSSLLWRSVAILVCLGLSTGFELGSDGGYKITIAVEENVVPGNLNVATFVENIRAVLLNFNQHLFTATRGTFHLSDVDIILPRLWDATAVSPTPATALHSVTSSQVRLIENTQERPSFPFVNNPHPCGLPGKFIQLPLDFFDSGNNNNGKFGNAGKALLTQWARYRYGVWEEHGYPGDAQFPYFYLNKDGDAWDANSCSNVRVEGSYETTAGVTCATNVAPADDCRFIPDPNPASNSEVTSSLMSFHSIETVAHFCTDEGAHAHNKYAPNKQNLFCNYQSAWSVIESTPDYKAVVQENTPEHPLLPNFQVFQHKPDEIAKPALYILLDDGKIVTDSVEHDIVNRLWPVLAGELIGDENFLVVDKTTVAAGVFPGQVGLLDTNHVFEALSADYRNELLDFLVVPIDFTGPETRDFAGALAQVIHEVESLSSENGAMVLVLKTGTAPTEFFGNGILYEPEVEAALLKNNIKVYAVEISGEEDHAKNLVTLATATGGTHHSLSEADSEQIQLAVGEIKESIGTVLNGPALTKEAYLTVHRGIVELDVETVLNVNPNTELTISLVVPTNIQARLVIDGVPDNEGFPAVRQEWLAGQRQVHIHVRAENPEEGQTVRVKYACFEEAGQDPCATQGFLLATAKFIPEPVNLATLPEVARTKVTVASRQETNIDFLTTQSPYAINVKVELDDKPVKNAVVTAEAHYTDAEGQPGVRTFTLVDDGLGFPDTVKFDGVYSADLVPPTDGAYSFFVAVSYEPVPQNRLIPIDQSGSFGCVGACDATEFSEQINIRHTQLPTVSFTNVDSYPGLGVPARITNFNAALNDALTGVHFTFTSPKVVSSDPAATATKFVVYTAEDIDELLEGGGTPFDTWEDVEAPGTVVEKETIAVASTRNWFAVRAFVGENQSPPSNVGRVNGETEEEEGDDTTPPPTTVSPEEEGDFWSSAGGIVLIVFLVLLGVGAIGGGGYWYYRKRQSSQHGYGSGV